MSKATRMTMKFERMKQFNPYSDEWAKEGVEIFQINNYQYRLVKDSLIIDYYPTSGKYCDIKLNKWGNVLAHDLHKLFTPRKD